MDPIQRSYLIEVNFGNTVPGNGVNINFQDYPQLRNIFLTGVTVSDNNTVAISPSGKNVVTDLSGIAVTLMDTFNMEVVKNYPAKELDPYYQYGFYRDFKPINLQLTKSYITILDNTNLLANQSVIVNIFYYLSNRKS
ncbi:MAG: hypothetical protein ACK52I_26050 [Pseudomonadota bacterium]|jgi:hypothetical protein